jgi:hypothetical protein
MQRFSLLFLFCLLSGIAHADVIPPDVADCSSKKAGDACMLSMESKPGVCQESTCSRLDYSQGTPPKGSIEYPCLRCTPGAANTPASTNTTAPAKVDPPTKTKGCTVDPVGGAGLLSLVMFLSGILLLRRKTSPRAD